MTLLLFCLFGCPGHLPDNVTQILTRLRITDERYGLRKRHLDAWASAAFGEPTRLSESCIASIFAHTRPATGDMMTR